MNHNLSVKYKRCSRVCVGALSAIRSPLSAQRAFTLIELLVVIVVMAILLSIAFPLARYAIYRANLARREAMQAKIKMALEEYRATYGEYPVTPSATPSDVNRHYYLDFTAIDTVFGTHVPIFAGGTSLVETLHDIHGSNACSINYSLTYPLMIKRLEEGKRPFMEFPLVDAVYFALSEQDKITWIVKLRGKKTKVVGILGKPTRRYMAIDPVTGAEWEYTCTNGLHYTLTP